MHRKYVERAKGKMRAVASLTDEQLALMHKQPKGDIVVSVKVTDETGEEPETCEMTWA